MTEASFWALLRSHLGIKMYRIESRVGAGIPDVHYVSSEGQGWIELKYIPELPQKGAVNIGLKRAQQLWLKNYGLFGGKAWILLRIGRDAILLFDGKHSEEIGRGPNYSNLSEITSWSKFGNMTQKDWKELSQCITGQN
jgi:hypothetical protein